MLSIGIHQSGCDGIAAEVQGAVLILVLAQSTDNLSERLADLHGSAADVGRPVHAPSSEADNLPFTLMIQVHLVANIDVPLALVASDLHRAFSRVMDAGHCDTRLLCSHTRAHEILDPANR